MASTSGPVRRQYNDIFDNISHASATATVSGVTTGTTGTLAVTVPGVAADGTWEVIAETTTATLGALVMTGNVTAANTVTLYFANTTAGTLTPTAASRYTVVVGHLNPRFTA